MSAMEKLPSRSLLVGAVVGLIVGCLFGWLVIGWALWPVQYVGEAYTYELNSADKADYVAAVLDSYNLNRRVELAQQRFTGWTTEEKVSSMADLFTQYQMEGRAQEAQAIIDLATTLGQTEGWDPATVDSVIRDLADQYAAEGKTQQASYLNLLANELGVMGAPIADEAAAPPATEEAASSGGGLGSLTPLLLLLLLLVAVFVVAIYIFMRRRKASTTHGDHVSAENAWLGEDGMPLLIKKSTYRLGMDNFDESFSIEGEDGAFKGECGMGISEIVGDESPRRAMAFEVWLFDKSDIRTVTKVLMSEHAYNNETLRNKLAARGEPILIEEGKAITLETTSLALETKVVEMEYGEGTPESGYFNQLSVSMVVSRKPASEENAYSSLSSIDLD
jgi:hypothetical protein